ncbi:glycosyltransferase family 2 protein [Candidatus Parcubacteria bacterium]|nr:MAG: glycosyltransferase family 2 protein [Candidatus Parcubacteria bacterium]
MALPKVGIVLVNYRDYARRFLVECRDSLRAQNYPHDLMRIYIVDNASSEETRNFLRQTFPEAEVIARLDGNYAAANNRGIERARANGCHFFVIANMDTVFHPDWLKELVLAMQNNPRAGIAQSKILLYPKNSQTEERPLINSTGNLLHYLGFGFTQDYRRPDYNIEGYPVISGYASGCSFIIRREVLDKIGGYNEEYYMYHDDIELSWRAKLAGWTIILAPRSVVYHKYEFSRSIRMLYYMERNRHLVMFHFYRWRTLALILPAWLVMELGMWLYALWGGWLGVKARAMGYFLRPSVWFKIAKTRCQSNKWRCLADKDILATMVGRVEFQEINNPLLKYLGNPFLDWYGRVIKKLISW